nr:MAG TPA: MarR family [Caudoviricetes sp.]
MIAETSIKAYRTIKPFLNGKRAEIYEFMKKRPNGATRQEISRRLKKPINSVCGRVNELLGRGYLVVVGTKKDAVTGHSTEILKVVERVA